ncbi:YtxH domain-containing protein [Streptomyces sp. KR80]|uniref:YtxH domain-containing protein n=1 Tax=Streptomyces sp. KR80 TaxID=3457426 RepID=UPI003FD64045
MRYRFTFIFGLAVGYVLGARAGRERYEQLVKSARQLSENPAVRNAAEAAATNSRSVAAKAADKVTATVGHRLPESVSARVRSFRDHYPPAEDDWGTSNT